MAAMKRAAESQLTREQAEDDDVVEVMPVEGGFKKADEAVLAKRPMKGLPKRGNAVAATFDASDSNKFNFGATSLPFAAPSSSFTFTTPRSAPTPPTTQPPSTTPPFSFATPVVSPSASSASKQMANLLSLPPLLNGVHTPTASRKASTTLEDDPELKYYASLRGLNGSARETIREMLGSDPFVDLGMVLDVYKEYRSKIQNEFEESRKSKGHATVNGISSTPSTSSPAKPASDAPSTSGISMPVPPKAFAGFGAPSISGLSTSGASTPVGGGFKPDFSKTSATPSAFAFPSSSSFGTAPAPLKPSPFITESGSSFKFGESSSSTDKSSPFGSGSAFGAAPSFGKIDGPSNSSRRSFGTSDANAPSVFGSSSAGPSAFALTGAKISGNGSSFGAKPSLSTSDDAKESTEDATNEAAASSSKTEAPSIVTSIPSKLSMEPVASGSKDVSERPSASDSVTPAAESRSTTPISTEGDETPKEVEKVSKILGENPHDQEGEGEEDEDTVYIVRAKIFRFGKKENQASWNEIGVGMLRIKKHKDTGVCRLLSRNSGNGKIMMNFKLYHGFKVARSKQVLTFVGHDNGSSVSFRVRVKDEPGAIAFQEAIQKAMSSPET